MLRLLSPTLLLFLVAATLFAQPLPLNCTANAGVPPIVRYPGIAELLSDLMIVCTGGIATAAGAPVPTADISVTFNTDVTNRVVWTGGWSDALLLIDEPAPGSRAVCPTSTGYCTIAGTGTGWGVYTGTAQRPNVFHGRVTGPSTLTWPAIPFDPPGTSGAYRVLRFVNMRANTIPLGPPSGLIPPTVSATVSLTGIPLANPQLVLGFSQPGLQFGITSPVPELSRSQSINVGLLSGSSAGAVSVNTVFVKENFATALKARTYAPYMGPDISPPPAAQNVLGAIYNSETGFFDPGIADTGGNGAIQVAGLSDFGARFVVEFVDVPKDLVLFLPSTSQWPESPGVATCIARRIDNPAGPFSPLGAAGTLTALTTNPATGNPYAVYEILLANPGVLDQLRLKVYPAYQSKADGGKKAKKAEISVRVYPAPASTDWTASASAPLPRFSNSLPESVPIFSIGK